MEISYNVLNLADSIGGNVHYEYLADGTKLAARDATGNGYLYKGSLVYSVNNGALTLESAAFDGGRFIDGEMHYFFTDHLGSTRAAITISEGDGISIVERNDYLPLGGRIANTTQPTADNLFRFSGKELQHIGSLTTPYYDFGARLYDPNGAAWLHPDPLAEKYYGISPYAYCAGNPIRFIDTDGKEPRIYVETKGFGHAFVSVGTGDNTVVYTYGRYGALGKDKSSARSSTPTGDGILIRLTGGDAKQFIKDQMLTNEAVVFELKDGSDELVAKHFEDKFNSSDIIPKIGRYANNENARVIDQYNILSNNCVTTTVEGAQSGVKERLNLNNLIAPDALKKHLNMKSKEPNSSVVKITYEEIKENLKLSNGASSTW